MAEVMQAVKAFGLSEFYLSLSAKDKMKLAEYTQYLQGSAKHSKTLSQTSIGNLPVSNGLELLWAAAAKAMDKKDYAFAEGVLNYALNLAQDQKDLGWLHANLAQICYHRYKLEPEKGRIGIGHCRELIKMGFMKSWALDMIDEFMLFQM